MKLYAAHQLTVSEVARQVGVARGTVNNDLAEAFGDEWFTVKYRVLRERKLRRPSWRKVSEALAEPTCLSGEPTIEAPSSVGEAVKRIARVRPDTEIKRSKGVSRFNLRIGGTEGDLRIGYTSGKHVLAARSGQHKFKITPGHVTQKTFFIFALDVEGRCTATYIFWANEIVRFRSLNLPIWPPVEREKPRFRQALEHFERLTEI